MTAVVSSHFLDPVDKRLLCGVMASVVALYLRVIGAYTSILIGASGFLFAFPLVEGFLSHPRFQISVYEMPSA